MDPFYEDYTPTTNNKDIKIYRNGDSNLCCTVTIRDNTKFHEIRKTLQQKWDTYFNRLRLFNQEGVEITEDDIDYIKNGTVLFASKGEEFDESFQLAEYEQLQDIGEGGFGKVVLGRHKQTGEKVAIKMVKQTLTNAQDVDMIFREARALKSLKHDNIVKIYNAFFLQNLQTVYIMEYLEGGELLQYLQTKGKFEENEARHYFKQLVSAISFCHQKKIIHRDLKLENLLLTSKDSGVIKCIDFGISGFASNDNPENADAGSLRYMAPELLKGLDKAVSPLVDVWSMGIILYGMLFGTLPFTGNTNKEIIAQISEGRVMIPTDLINKLSQNCQDCLYRALEPDPKKRITSIELLNHPFVTNENTLSTNSNSTNKPKLQNQLQQIDEVEIPVQKQMQSATNKKQNLQFSKQHPQSSRQLTQAQKKTPQQSPLLQKQSQSVGQTTKMTKFSKK
ncbi:unnamed protein product (macronuclear) [Paramecium tetraurelia]|uniref:Protein kinase domain-containing protein n=1 Tax=Paramecium tetraurelia TaxID=5888 RepID=A0CYU6_PARTE|nr:uncharacterized protein GSPATT00011564001 [Paramecium tetraurelia]CAK75963.1 unnamed protein product [Paramecium tetraurelia]|eukprot:XP_001443360.1 hypothetical protein (macronuclear) [Paramecium tetraurelia strain d4-2]